MQTVHMDSLDRRNEIGPKSKIKEFDMSTRCQVKVIQEGLDWGESVTLYHHTDGYPEHMIPTINRAFNYQSKYGNDEWKKGRAGKVASLLCWAEPGVFEPETSHELHPDIEYYYKLYCVSHKQGAVGDKPTWEVEIFDGSGSRLEHKRATLSELMEIYAQ